MGEQLELMGKKLKLMGEKLQLATSGFTKWVRSLERIERERERERKVCVRERSG